MKTVLSRGYAASARLDLQHYLWKDQVGYLLNPRIPVHSTARIADVGTGTGLWALDLARALPGSSKLDGYDIDTSQYPPAGWLPENVSFKKLDAFGELPAELVGVYDIVHLRAFAFVCSNNDASPLLNNALRLLKPGGWLQWGEPDITARNKVRAGPENDFEKLDSLQQFLRAHQDQNAQLYPTWVPALGKMFEDRGLQDIELVRTPTSTSHLMVAMENNFLAYEELSYSGLDKLGGGQGQRLREMLQDGYEEYRKGSAINMDRVTVVGRKPAKGSRM